MLAFYFDDNVARRALARSLRASGLVVFLPTEVGSSGLTDEGHMEVAARLSATLVTTDQGDFDAIWAAWYAADRDHAGLVVCHQVSLTLLVEWLTPVARLVSVETMRNKHVRLEQFRTEELGLATAQSLAASA